MKTQKRYTAERMTEINAIYGELAKTLKGNALMEAFIEQLEPDEAEDALEHITISWANKPFANFQIQNAKKGKIIKPLNLWHGENADVEELPDVIRVKFPDIPSTGMRAKMKEHGLVWSKDVSAWQGPRDPKALDLVKRIAGVTDPKAYMA